MTFRVSIPLDKPISFSTEAEHVAHALDLAAAQLRNSQEFGQPCADGYTTQNITDEDGEILGTMAAKTYEVRAC